MIDLLDLRGWSLIDTQEQRLLWVASNLHDHDDRYINTQKKKLEKCVYFNPIPRTSNS
jgi:hypothetical protein